MLCVVQVVLHMVVGGSPLDGYVNIYKSPPQILYNFRIVVTCFTGGAGMVFIWA